MHYLDRAHAGRQLADALRGFAGRPDLVILALPRGGVPVAERVAEALDAPLDVFLVRKLGFPGSEEFAMGAIASGGIQVLNEPVLRSHGVPDALVEAVARREGLELARREKLYRDGRPPVDVRGKTVILVDDGFATGCSMRAALTALRTLGPRRIVVAVPVGPRETAESLRRIADEVVCPATPEPFLAVGHFYEDFTQTTDREVAESIARAARRPEPEDDVVGRKGMRTSEVASGDWTAFFDSFSRRHQGWLVKLSVLDPRLGAQVEAVELPLQGIVADRRGLGISIQLGERPDDLEHLVRHPRRVRVELGGDGDEAEAAIEIESADGTKAILEFRCVALPETVDGIAPTVADLR